MAVNSPTPGGGAPARLRAFEAGARSPFRRFFPWINGGTGTSGSAGAGGVRGGEGGALALALNVHYSPIIKSDELTLEVPVNTAN